LEEALQRRHGIGVDWQHRLTSLEPNNAHVVAQVDKLGYEGKGYIVPSFEEAVEKTLTASADFLVGADGAQSAVRNALGIAYEPVNKAERFRVFELEVKGDVPKEFQLVLDGKSISAYWPLPGANCRWTFQIDCREDPDETHDKERTALWLDEPARNRSNREILRQLIEARAPWFKTDINEINWTTEVQFQGCLAKRFGQGRCWLVGDSAHQTSPAGMQSMNVGLAEAEALAQSLTGILRKGAALGSLETYGLESRNAWEKLLGRSGKLQRPGVSKKGSASVPEARLLSSLPASGDHLVALLKQMNAELAPA
jgi:2-polyprenyl-6-methoxyphenol hydroxylase-like FAD-dependent oxidoreductase